VIGSQGVALGCGVNAPLARKIDGLSTPNRPDETNSVAISRAKGAQPESPGRRQPGRHSPLANPKFEISNLKFQV